MNEIIANALVDQLTPLVKSDLITTVAGLVEMRQTDAFNKEKDKGVRTLPLPLRANPADVSDWTTLLPDPKKRGIVFFEDGGHTQKQIQGMWQIGSRLSLIWWHNLPNIDDPARKELAFILFGAMFPNGRRTINPSPGISLSINSMTSLNSDPFSKYTAYQSLFNFRNQPYGWLAYNLTLNAYISPDCIA